MKKSNEKWKVSTFIDEHALISYPEYQREPSVWDLEKRQRLIDSMLRGIDISSIYLYKTDEGTYDCVDGRQRLGAILSYVGKNFADENYNGFPLTIINEIYDDKTGIENLDRKKFEELPGEIQKKFLEYEMSVVILSDVEDPLELNLFFLRLQLGLILNSGEKLNAMAGDMRDLIFTKLKFDPVFEAINVRYRRFTKEQIAAQITLNHFSFAESGHYHKSRYVDLLQFLKEKARLNEKDRIKMEEIQRNLKKINELFGEKLELISNRALVVSLYLFTDKLIRENREKQFEDFSDFFTILVKTMKWQIPKGVTMDQCYSYIALDFQTYVSSAADERSAIEKREKFLEREFEYYLSNGHRLKGDSEFEKEHGKSPDSFRESSQTSLGTFIK